MVFVARKNNDPNGKTGNGQSRRIGKEVEVNCKEIPIVTRRGLPKRIHEALCRICILGAGIWGKHQENRKARSSHVTDFGSLLYYHELDGS